MSTVVLVLLCLAIAGRELYLASDKRLPRAQAELRDLRAQLAELARRHEALQAEVARAAAEAPVVTVPQAPPEPPPGSLYAAERPGPAAPSPEVVAQVESQVAKLGVRVERLEQELGSCSAALAEVELDRAARHALARSLDAAERAVGELRSEMLERLGREEGVVPGLLLSEDGEAEALLAGAFERCATEYGLRVRVREERSAASGGGGQWGTAYYLSGRRADAVAEELFTYVRGLYDPRDPSALAALLVELAQLSGGGLVRLGAFTAVRASDALLCGLLPEDIPEGIEPRELAARLRELPEELHVDLNWLTNPTA